MSELPIDDQTIDHAEHLAAVLKRAGCDDKWRAPQRRKARCLRLSFTIREVLQQLTTPNPGDAGKD